MQKKKTKALAYRDISTTMIYSDVSPDHLGETVERLELGSLRRTHSRSAMYQRFINQE